MHQGYRKRIPWKLKSIILDAYLIIKTANILASVLIMHLEHYKLQRDLCVYNIL